MQSRSISPKALIPSMHAIAIDMLNSIAIRMAHCIKSHPPLVSTENCEGPTAAPREPRSMARSQLEAILAKVEPMSKGR